MLNLSGLTFAQKLHAVKYGSLDDQPEAIPMPTCADKIDAFMLRFEELHKTMTARKAFEHVSTEYGDRYKNFQSFAAARLHWYRKRHGHKPIAMKFEHTQTKTASAFLDQFEPLAKEVGPLKAYNHLVGVTGKSWASYQSFLRSRFAYYRHRGKFPPALPGV